MKKSLLFIGIVITSLVMLFTVHEAKSFSSQSPGPSKEVRRSVMLTACVSGPRLPLNNSDGKNTTYFKVTPSFNGQAPTYVIRLNQQVLCSFKTLFAEQNIEKYRLIEPIGFHTFLMTLFRVIASPNAP